jgi:hypothetical protein
LKNCKITRVMNAVAAGTSVQTSTTVDMQGYDGVMFIAALGALTATQVTSIKARQGALAAMSDAADLEGTLVGPMADSGSNKVLVLDVHRPRERYVNCVVGRGTANAVIDSVIAIQYGGSIPATQPSSVAFSEHQVSPAEGTA